MKMVIDWDSREGVFLLDALHNCSPDTVKTPEDVTYGNGVLVGVVASLMYAGFYFDDAWEQILRRVRIDQFCVPLGWPTLHDYDVALNRKPEVV